MEILELKASVRAHTGKKGAKECRNKGLLPGIFYGKDDESTPLEVNPKKLNQVLHTHAGGNVIIKLTLEGKDGDPVNVVVKELQVDSIKDTMRHVDFCQIALDRKIRTVIPFKVIGESPGVKEGGILEHTLWELEIESMPLDIPDFIEIDVSELTIGDSLAVSDLSIPETVTVLTDDDVAVVSIAAPRAEEVVEVAAEVEVEGAEPEVISAEARKAGEGAEDEKEATAEEKRKSRE